MRTAPRLPLSAAAPAVQGWIRLGGQEICFGEDVATRILPGLSPRRRYPAWSAQEEGPSA